MPYYPKPVPPVPKPTLPLPVDSSRLLIGDDTQTLLARAKTDDGSHLEPTVLLNAIDPTTGDSALHRAAAVGNYAFMEAATGFGKNLWSSPRRLGLRWVLLTHQNLAGDTALHTAAKAGNMKGVKSVYRLFWSSSSHDPDEDDDHETWSPEDAAENWVWERDEGDGLVALDFICMKNKAGRDAATEARAAGHDDIATLLDRVAGNLDSSGKRADEGYLREARRTALAQNYYRDDETHDVHV
ncbi:hypothetical protein DL546_002365 [Coniochaeta pulveracea]|uniref:Uncharacterized protein n=1 Tax=Coniochaeta pulveracea TaxID=177199 RepID=A0A420Y6G3_9PEZI|nr:hypothetical protein DL546_002365 [Coniochaeta pulveracea]